MNIYRLKERRNARDEMATKIAAIVSPYLNEIGWQHVSSDLVSLALGLVAVGSQTPRKDLMKISAFARRYDWRRAKRFHFAAKMGVNPDRVTEKDIQNGLTGQHISEENDINKTPDESAKGEKTDGTSTTDAK